MTLLVLSDSHGRADYVRDVVTKHPNADTVLFLGDGLRDLELLSPEQAARLCTVRGNCDFSFAFFGDIVPTERLLRFGEYTVLMLHGHTVGVKSGTDRAVVYAAERGADILLYGHTHVAEERYLPSGTEVGGVTLSKPMYVMNPGSLGASRDGGPSYGLVELTSQGVLLSHGSP